jgi:uncharacterized protein YdeI (YjbR/CyaY-like superfamily)
VPAPRSIRFFRTPAELREWFRGHHATERELWVGFYKRATGRPSITWPESVDEALCVGWIDGIRKRVDDERYTIRFTPRRARSIWSAVNIRCVQALADAKRMRAPGTKAFAARQENRSGIYAYEQRGDRLEEPYASLLRNKPAAAAFFEAQSASYRKTIGWWIVSAKKEETRLARLARLIDASAAGKRLL